jgi:hypothetical protein
VEELVDHPIRQMSFTEAAYRGLVQPTVFEYDTETGQYTWNMEMGDVTMNPGRGYWILLYNDMWIFMTYPEIAPSGVPAESGAAEDGWRADLVLGGAGLADVVRTIGMSSVASDELDVCDIVAPPAVDNGAVQMHLVAPDRGAACMVELQSSVGAEKNWYLEVAQAQPGQELKLSWPDLSSLPSEYTPILEDLATGVRCYMRTTSGYSFVVGDSGARTLKVTVRPASQTTALVSQVLAESTSAGNYALNYSLTAPAAVDVKIVNISGVPIRQLASASLQEAGSNTVLWNGRSDSGTKVPPGRYLARITARSPESGQESTVMTTLDVIRP